MSGRIGLDDDGRPGARREDRRVLRHPTLAVGRRPGLLGQVGTTTSTGRHAAGRARGRLATRSLIRSTSRRQARLGIGGGPARSASSRSRSPGSGVAPGRRVATNSRGFEEGGQLAATGSARPRRRRRPAGRWPGLAPRGRPARPSRRARQRAQRPGERRRQHRGHDEADDGDDRRHEAIASQLRRTRASTAATAANSRTVPTTVPRAKTGTPPRAGRRRGRRRGGPAAPTAPGARPRLGRPGVVSAYLRGRRISCRRCRRAGTPAASCRSRSRVRRSGCRRPRRCAAGS